MRKPNGNEPKSPLLGVRSAAVRTWQSAIDGNDLMRPRIFVSSVMDDFGEHRQAVKRGILSAGGEPVLVEDFPSLSVSPRNACLDGVASCDIYIAILGNRGGWTTQSGKLVVEEEYEEAIRHRITILAFIQLCDRDTDGERLVSKVSNYVDGLFRGGPHPSDRGLTGLRCRSGVGFMPPRCSCPAAQEVRADRSMLHRG